MNRRRNASWKGQEDDGSRKNSLPVVLSPNEASDDKERKGSLPAVLDGSEDGKSRRKRAPRNLRLRPRQSSRLKRRSLLSVNSAKSDSADGRVESPDQDDDAWEDDPEFDTDMEFDDFYEQLWAPRPGVSVLAEQRRAKDEAQRRAVEDEDDEERQREDELRAQLEQMRQQLKDALEAQQRAEERAGELDEYGEGEEGRAGRKGAPPALHLIGSAFGALGPRESTVHCAPCLSIPTLPTLGDSNCRFSLISVIRGP